MTETEFLSWVRGPAFEIATFIFVVGILVRILEILILGRKTNLAQARGSAIAGGSKTLFSQFIPYAGTFRRSAFTVISGYLFHIGLFITIFLYAPHILLFESVFGISWPSLPTPVIDAITVATIITLFAILIYRLQHPVLRFISRFHDYLAWLVTILPLITGYLAFHRIGGTPTTLLAIHILSVELLMILFPFTRLIHTFTLFMARWYNGAMAGFRGVSA